MTYRLATSADHNALAAYLDTHLAQAMFPRANLAEFGFGGTHPYACRYWIKPQGGRVTAALALANSGMIMPCLPPEDAPDFARLLAGEMVSALTGTEPQVRALEAALAIAPSQLATATNEPHFHLAMAQLRVPEGPGRLVPFHEGPTDVLCDWLSAYLEEVVHLSPTEAREQATQTYARNCDRGQHAVLIDGATPLAMTGLNARVGTMGQVGGVYTPAPLRGRGHARRAVALHLQQLASDGPHEDGPQVDALREVVLYAAGPAASRTYRAIGFREIGAWRYLALNTPQRIA